MEASPGNRELLDYIRQQIANHGPVTFKWFMQQALYHPKLGYYGAGRAQIGRQGDFYTNVSVGKLFGELIAKQFEEMWTRMNRPVSFTILEEGANDARFAADVLSWTKRFSPDLHACLKYWIIEPNPKLQAEQQATLSTWPRNKVRWSQGLDQFETGSLCGVHFSNELLDAFPVHLVTSAGGAWQENFVDVGRQGFRFVYGPPSNSLLRAALERLPVPEVHGSSKEYRTEVNLAAPRWIEGRFEGPRAGLLPDRRLRLSARRVLFARTDDGHAVDVPRAPARGRSARAGRRVRPDRARRVHDARRAGRGERPAPDGVLRPAPFSSWDWVKTNSWPSSVPRAR